MFTDWSELAGLTLEQARYFYARGALWGIVTTLVVTHAVVPWICKHLPKNRRPQ